MNVTRSKYRWISPMVGELKPGEAYLSRRGKEFECEPVSFAGVVYTVAREAGWKATVITLPNAVVFAFYPPDSYLRPNLAAYPIVKRMKGEV